MRRQGSALTRRITRMSDTAMNVAVNTAFDAAMRINRRRYWPPLEQATADPALAQAETLQRILDQNVATTFGRSHDFGAIDNGDQFRRVVAVQDYESLRPLIEKQERNATAELTSAQPVLYAQTSGTSGSPKYLPITSDGIDRVARIQRIFATAVHAGTEMFSGKIVGIGSPAVEGRLPGGSPFGSASGMVYEGMPSVVRRKYVLEPEVLAIGDHEVRYQVIAALCMAEQAVTGVATANPSTLLRLRAVMVENWDMLVKAIGDGHLAVAESLPGDQQAAVARRLRGDRRRADELDNLRSLVGDDVGYRHLWPNLSAITTWTGGSAGFALSALEPFLDPSTRIVELGYSASEVRGTIGIDPTSNLCLPLLSDNWYEFVDRRRREEVGPEGLGTDDFMGIESLDPAQQYYVYVTTFDGLYRYDMNDIVEVTGRFESTPTLGFVQKGRGVTNITGEKLSESQVLDAMNTAQRRHGVALTFFILLADEQESRYLLHTEDPGSRGLASELAEDLDALLSSSNIEYGSKRSSGRLGPVEGRDLMPGAADAYRAACVEQGQRDAQFKYLHLQYVEDCTFDFAEHQLDPGSDPEADLPLGS